MNLLSPETDGEEDCESQTHCPHRDAPLGPDFCPRCCQVMDQTLFFIVPEQIKSTPRAGSLRRELLGVRRYLWLSRARSGLFVN